MIWGEKNDYLLEKKSMNNKGLIDSNIFIYAHDIRSPFFTVTHAFLSNQIQKNGIIITSQILLETYRILTQKTNRLQKRQR